MKTIKICVRIDEADSLILNEFTELSGLTPSVVVQTVLKVFLYNLIDSEGNLKQSVKVKLNEFKSNGGDSEELSAPEEPNSWE